MSQQFIFTPGQRQEALTWIKENCPEAWLTFFNIHDTTVKNPFEDYLIDMFFKLKSVTFPVKPDEFIVGIEYKDAEKVRTGKEAVNIRLQNPHKRGEFDEVSYAVIVNLLTQLKA